MTEPIDTIKQRFYVGNGPNTTRENVAKITAKWYTGATIFETLGLWLGETECSYVVEVIAPACTGSAPAFAKELSAYFEQDVVIYTTEAVQLTVVKAEEEAYA